MTQASDFTHIHQLRVRWVEVDAQQVVFNGHYLMYLDTAMGEFWRASGLPYPDAFAFMQGDVFVRSNTLQYHAPARLDDRLDIGLRCERIGNSSITMVWAVWAQGRLLVTGEAVYVFTSLARGKSAPVPEGIKAQLQAYAKGEPVHAVRSGAWAEMAEGARAVRRAVFIIEQAIDEADEWDEADAGAIHVVASNLDGLPLATGRLIYLDQPAGYAKVGRMAVLRSSRGVGLGDKVLQALMQEARVRDISELSLHAQCSAQAFYARQDFVASGEPFDEVGIPHQRMTRTL
jgi:YbgC/YbaW family acyl-CoA thioester hydrolase